MENMEQIENVETKETMTAKEFFKKYRGEIIAGVALTGAAIGCIILNKKFKNKIADIESDIAEKYSKLLDLETHNDRLNNNVISLQNMLDFVSCDNDLMSAALTEGVIQEAINSTNDKIGTRQSKLKSLEQKLKKAPEDEELITKILTISDEIKTLADRLSLYEMKVDSYEIKELTK